MLSKLSKHGTDKAGRIRRIGILTVPLGAQVEGQVALFAQQLAPYAPLAAAAAAAVGADAPPAALAAAAAGRVPGAYALGVTVAARRTYVLPPPKILAEGKVRALCSSTLLFSRCMSRTS